MQLKHAFYFWGLFFSISILVGSACSPTVSTESNGAYRQLLHWLTEKDFFRLAKQLSLLKQRINPVHQLYFQAHLNNAFNRNQEAVHCVDSLLKNFSYELQDSLKAELYLLRGDSYFKLFQYAKAARNDSVLLSKYHHVLGHKAADIKNKLIIYNGLKNMPQQQTFIAHTTTFQWKRNKIGIVEIPVQRHHVLYDAVFDTRANISVITQTYAAKLHLLALPVFYDEGSGITGIRFKTSLAIADSLYLGSILVRHAVFQVVPDAVLYIAPVKFQMNIIIGFPIIEQLKEVHFYKNGNVKIPANASRSDLHNLALDGLNPVISLRTSSGDTLSFAFDFGASKSMLFAAYFQKYRESVLASGIKTTTEYGGAGGGQQKQVFTLPSVDLFFGEKKITLDSVDVLPKKIYPEETFYGNIGQDFVNLFQELVVNFQYMYMKGL